MGSVHIFPGIRGFTTLLYWSIISKERPLFKQLVERINREMVYIKGLFVALNKRHFSFSVMQGKVEGKFGMGIDENRGVAFNALLKRMIF